MTEILVALLGAIGVLGVALINHKTSKDKRTAEHKLKQAVHEIGLRNKALSFVGYTKNWYRIEKDLDVLTKETAIDRFLILNAWNGHLCPERTTAIYQKHFDGTTVIDYFGVPVDPWYQVMLSQVESNGFMTYKIDDIQGNLREWYEAEGVTESALFFIEGTEHGGGSRAVSYCSFATHAPGGFANADIARCRAFVGKLRLLAVQASQNA